MEKKVTAIEEANDLSTLSVENLIGNLMAYDVNLQERRKEESRKKSIAFKAIEDHDESNEDDDINLMTRAFRNFIKNGKFRNFKDNSEPTCLSVKNQDISRQTAHRTKAMTRRECTRRLLKHVGRMIQHFQRMKQICALLQRRYVKLQSILNYFVLLMMYIRN